MTDWRFSLADKRKIELALELDRRRQAARVDGEIDEDAERALDLCELTCRLDQQARETPRPELAAARLRELETAAREAVEAISAAYDALDGESRLELHTRMQGEGSKFQETIAGLYRLRDAAHNLSHGRGQDWALWWFEQRCLSIWRFVHPGQTTRRRRVMPTSKIEARRLASTNTAEIALLDAVLATREDPDQVVMVKGKRVTLDGKAPFVVPAAFRHGERKRFEAFVEVMAQVAGRTTPDLEKLVQLAENRTLYPLDMLFDPPSETTTT